MQRDLTPSPGDSSDTPRSEQVIASALDAIVVIDAANIILQFNTAAEQVFGWRREDVLGREVSMLMPPEFRSAHVHGVAENVRSGKSKLLDQRLELEALRADGSRFPIELSVSRMGHGDAPMFTAFIRDITARKQAATHLQMHGERLGRLAASQRELAGLTLGPEQLFDRVAEIAQAAMEADGAVFEIPDGTDLVFRSASGSALAAVGLRLSIVDSLSGTALTSQKTLVCIDSETDPRVDVQACRVVGLRSMMVAALHGSSGPIGVIKVMSKSPGFFADDDAPALDILVGSLAAVLARSERQEAQDREAQRQAFILRFQQRLAASGAPVQTLMEQISAAAMELTGADGAAVDLVDGADLVATATSGSLAGLIGSRTPKAGSLSGLSTLKKQVLLAEDTETDARVNREVCRRDGVRSLVVAPLQGEREVIGVLKVLSGHPGAFNDQHADILHRLVQTLGTLIQRRAAAERMVESERRYRMLFASNPSPMWVFDMETLRFLEVNEAAMRAYGYTRDEFLQRSLLDLRPEDEGTRRDLVARIRSIQGPTQRYQATHVRKSGDRFDVEISADDIEYGGRRARLVLATDVTARVLADRQRSRAERALRMLSQSNEAVIQIADEGDLLAAVCDMATGIGGYDSVVIGLVRPADTGFRFLVHRGKGRHCDELANALEMDRLEVPRALSVRTLLRDAATHVGRVAREAGLASMVLLPVDGGDGVFGVLSMFSVTSRELADDEQQLLRDLAANVGRGLASLRSERERHAIRTALEFAATHDALTGLERYAVLQARADAQLGEGTPMALLLVALDRFAAINQTLSHLAADEVLRTIALRLAALVPEDALAHLAGDQFVVVVPRGRAGDVDHCAEALRATVAVPVEVAGFRLSLTATVGVAVSPEQGDTCLELLRRAEAAAEQGKAGGRDCIRWFEADAMQALEDRIQLGAMLRKAIDANELQLAYQPQFRYGQARPVGFEALLRWRHPTLGPISPVRFIPVAETLGLMPEIGNWVIQAACRQIRCWADAGLGDVKVAVNVSALQLQRPGLLATVTNALADSGVAPGLLELELTESILMEDLQRTRSKLEDFRALGVSISLDDFGTGYSSLAYLRELALDKLKIDRSFVTGLPGDPRDAAMARTIVSIAHQYELLIAAEGVETQAQADFLHTVGCDQLQGFLLGRPMDAELASQLIRSD